MKFFTLCLFCTLLYTTSKAQNITGKVSDSAGNALGYATIEVVQKNTSTTANSQGIFSINLSPGNYTISCQHIGYQRQEKSIEIVSALDSRIDFILKRQELTLAEVVVKKGEDPAYEIIRNTIKKRPLLKSELQSFTAEVYTKGQMQLRDFPNKFLGRKVDFEDGDSSKKKMLFLSETVSKYAVQKGGAYKVEVIASKVSGQSDGFGLSAPFIISFYENNINIGSNINPRGFVSPIADNALNFYRYKYEGAFLEGGKQISRIQVIAKRKFEPLFSGYINIIEDEWRIHSLQLQLTKSSGMELVDTLQLEQLYVPGGNGTWVIKNQVIYPAIKMFGFDAYGSFVNVYSNYDLSPRFEKNFFNNTVIKYADSANKKSPDYWNQTRPIVLQQEEVKDYQQKDSLELVRKSPAYLDSIDRVRNKVTVSNLLITGLNISRQKSRSSISVPGLAQILSFNTVEGVVVKLNGTYFKRIDTVSISRRSIAVTPEVRYGFSNKHVNSNLSMVYRFGKKYFNSVSVSGGSDVFQFNNAAPVGVLGNTLSTLLYRINNLKIYEAVYGRIGFSKGVGSGLTLQAGLDFQDRSPLENTTDFTLDKGAKDSFTANHPLPQFNRNIERHQAAVFSLGIGWQLGEKYIQYPEQTVAMGSGAPKFFLRYTQAVKGVIGSDVGYSKLLFNVRDDINLKLFGSFNYYLDLGGFLSRDSAAIPDYTHYQGNMSSLLTGSYLDRFQLVPHYLFSNTNSFYSLLYSEHHFNGFLTNKIPGLKQLKWNLVTGANALYRSSGEYYVEPFVGLENIFKIIRVDYIWGINNGALLGNGFRIGIKTPFNNIR